MVKAKVKIERFKYLLKLRKRFADSVGTKTGCVYEDLLKCIKDPDSLEMQIRSLEEFMKGAGVKEAERVR